MGKSAFIQAVMVSLLSWGAFAESMAPEATKSEVSALRAQMVPHLESALARVCGADCPGFSVVVNTAGGTTGKKIAGDDLGFSSEQVIVDGTPRSVSVEVLVPQSFKPEQQEMVRLALSAEAKNRTDLPVSVRLKNVAAPAKPETKISSRDWLSFAKSGLWPFVLLALGGLCLFGLMYFLRDRRKIVEAKEEKLQASQEPVDTASLERAAYLKSVMTDRSSDLAWLVENSAAKNDLKTAQKLLRLFPGDLLSKNLSLQPDSASVFSHAVSQSPLSESDAALIPWLKSELDRAHWMRLAENAGPMARVSHLSPRQLASLFQNVPSAKEKAAILAHIPEQHWPQLLAALPSQEKIAVGTELARVQTGETESSADIEKNIVEQMERSKKMSRLDGVVEDYLYHLSDKEAGTLSNELAARSFVLRPRTSADEVVQSLSQQDLLEMVMKLEIEEIRTLLKHISPESLKKVNDTLPSKLRDRVSTPVGKTAATESAWIQTRMKWVKLYENQYGKDIQ